MAGFNDWGMKISQVGFDVKTATDKDLVMKSTLNQLKTAAVGTGISQSIAHGLAFVPVIFTQQTVAGKQTIIGDDYLTTVDTTNVNLGAFTTKYYIFHHQIN